jgi:hypothetical protein
MPSDRGSRHDTLGNLSPLVPVNIDFADLNYTVYQNEYGEFYFCTWDFYRFELVAWKFAFLCFGGCTQHWRVILIYVGI